MKKHLLIVVALSLLGGCNNQPPAPAPNPEPTPNYATGLIKPEHRDMGVLHFTPRLFTAPIPDEFDWVAQGYGTPVRDQGQCGSCWAFGGSQSLEMGYKIFAHQDIDFSEQQLVGNLFSGCGGGYFVYDWQVQNGQTDEKSCPYTASNHQCKSGLPVAGKPASGGMVGGFGRSPSVQEMQNAI